METTKIYFLQSGLTVIGKEDKKNDETLTDVLQVLSFPAGVSQMGGVNFITLYTPVGTPVNSVAITILKSDLKIMFEIKDYNKDKVLSDYGTVLSRLKHPNVVAPKSRIIA